MSFVCEVKFTEGKEKHVAKEKSLGSSREGELRLNMRLDRPIHGTKNTRMLHVCQALGPNYSAFTRVEPGLTADLPGS